MVLFLIEDYYLLEKYNTIWDKVSTDIKKEFDSTSVCNKKICKLKQNLKVINLQMFTIQKFLRWTLIILVHTLIILSRKIKTIIFKRF